jgi:hypothetical protein
MEIGSLNLPYLLSTALVLLLYLAVPVLIIVVGLLIYRRITRRDRFPLSGGISLEETNRKLDQLIALQAETNRLLQSQKSSG